MLYFVTICLDAMPFMQMQLATFNRLSVPWMWLVSEGAAANRHCTQWCQPQAPRLSRDGAHEFLMSLRDHPNVRVAWKQQWDGKLEMVNHHLPKLTQGGVLMQVDADEIWTAAQLEVIYSLFETHDKFRAARFYCRYFVGQNLITVGEDCYGNNPGEWLRAWKFSPGDRFHSHEPPVFGHILPHEILSRKETRSRFLEFDHYAYVLPEQVQFKQNFYGYRGAVEQWNRLQQFRGPWPQPLKKFLPWVDDRVVVDQLHK